MSTNAPKFVTFVTMPGHVMPGVEVLQLVDVVAEAPHDERLARIAARSLELLHDVVERELRRPRRGTARPSSRAPRPAPTSSPTLLPSRAASFSSTG